MRTAPEFPQRAACGDGWRVETRPARNPLPLPAAGGRWYRCINNLTSDGRTLITAVSEGLEAIVLADEEARSRIEAFERDARRRIEEARAEADRQRSEERAAAEKAIEQEIVRIVAESESESRERERRRGLFGERDAPSREALLRRGAEIYARILEEGPPKESG